MIASRSPSDSAVIATYMVLPGDTNAHGTAFGGKIMQWMDIAAAVAAGRHCGTPTVTAAVDDLHFAAPIRLGDVVIVQACVNFAGRTSLEVGIRVDREELATGGAKQHCLSAYFTFVGVDAQGAPIRVPSIVPANPVEVRRFEAAKLRRERRLKARREKPAAPAT